MRKKIALFSLVSSFVPTHKLKFKAKIKRSGVDKPEKVRIGYQVVDSSSLQVVRSGITNLKRSSGYTAKTSTITARADQSLTYHLNMKYTVGGKSSKSKISSPDTIPSVAQMDANPTLFPYCQ